MTYAQYMRLRDKAANRRAQAFAAGNAASLSGDWSKMLAACRENDAAHLEMCRVMAMASEVAYPSGRHQRHSKRR